AGPGQRLLGLLAAEQEAPEQRTRLVGRQLRLALAGLEHRARGAERLGVLGQVADLGVVAAAHVAGGERRVADERAQQRGLAAAVGADERDVLAALEDRKSTRLNSSHVEISYAVFCLKKKKK